MLKHSHAWLGRLNGASSCQLRTNRPQPASRLRIAAAMAWGLLVVVNGGTASQAAPNATTIGLGKIKLLAPDLTGAGITVAQVEASASATAEAQFEPAIGATGQSVSKFTFVNGAGEATGVPDLLTESDHATWVGQLFYGNPGGIAPGVRTIYIWAAGGLYHELCRNHPTLIPTGQTTAPTVVNQSYIFAGADAAQMNAIDARFDNYAALHNTLFISAIGDGNAMETNTIPARQINPPANAYNGIGVAALDGSSGTGPTWDGRSKPDIAAPGSETSYATPLVSGAATLLVQAGLEDRGGSDTNTAATDIRTIKALLLNGASKPAGWTNSYSITNDGYAYHPPSLFTRTPLDPRYGAGVVSIYNSYTNLVGGEHAASITAWTRINRPPSEDMAVAAEPALVGWNRATMGANIGRTEIDHYVFQLPAGAAASWNLTSTLDWNVKWAHHAVLMHHLYLFLFNSSGAIAWSKSDIDNVQQIVVTGLPPGRYDLAVMERGSPSAVLDCTYALAWRFSRTPAAAVRLKPISHPAQPLPEGHPGHRFE